MDRIQKGSAVDHLHSRSRPPKDLHTFLPSQRRRHKGATRERYGSGLVQIRVGKRILFKNIGSIGGVTPRLESHLENLEDHAKASTIDQFTGRVIKGGKGNGTVILSPHYILNGVVDIRDITSDGSGVAVRNEGGFTTKEEKQKGLSPGPFSNDSVIRDVKATYVGADAQLKPRHYQFLPPDLRNLISGTPISPFPHRDSFHGPSIAAVVHTSNYTCDFLRGRLAGVGTATGRPRSLNSA